MKLKWKICLGVLAALGFVGGGFALAPTIEFHRTAAGLPQALEEAKKVGMPLTAADLEIPGQVYATEEDVKLLARFGYSGDLKDLPSTFTNLTSTTPDWRKAERLFASHRTDLERVREIASRGAVCAKKDLDEGLDLRVPELQDAKYAATALRAHAALSAREGDIAATIRDLKHSGLLARACVDSGYHTGWLIGGSVDIATFRAAEFCMESFSKHPSALRQIREASLQEGNYNLYRPLRQDFYALFASIRNLERYGGQDEICKEELNPALPKGPILRTGIPGDVVSRAYMVRLIRNWAPILSLVKGDEDDAGRLKNGLSALGGEESEPLPPHYRLWDWVQPYGSNVAVYGLSVEASRRCTVALSLVLEFRARHGKFPANLSRAGVTLVDPFDQKPLRYRVEKGAVRIWSVGLDFHDNQGRSRLELVAGGTRESDVVATFPAIREQGY